MLNHHWRHFLSNRKVALYFWLLIFFGFLSVALFSSFMCWNETRPGFVFNDPILRLIPAVDFSIVTMTFTTIPFVSGFLYFLRRPKKTVYFFYATIFICLFRTTTLYLTPLDPPIGIIPLTDPVIEKLFYGNKVLLKDLFFSGHTANLILIGLILNHKIYSKAVFLCAAIVGILLMVQHVHYSIDVFAAPFFAILAYKMAVKVGDSTLLRQSKV
jgi:hypothetical protein